MDWISEIDLRLLLLINGAHSPFCDSLMWLISERLTWTIFYTGLVVCIIKTTEIKTALTFFLALSVAVMLSDQICSSLIRPLVARMRPSNPANPVSATITLVNGYTGGQYGFPSCHAANSTAMAVMTSLLFRSGFVKATMAVWVLTISYSRLYLGVHYPTDILGGITVGAICGAAVYYMAISTMQLRVVACRRNKIVAALFMSNLSFLILWALTE